MLDPRLTVLLAVVAIVSGWVATGALFRRQGWRDYATVVLGGIACVWSLHILYLNAFG